MHSGIMSASRTMQSAYLVPIGVIVLTLVAVSASGDTAWNSTSSSDWGTIGNWTNGLPSSGPQLAIYRGTATLQKSVNLGSPARETLGMRFTLTAGSAGYTFAGLGGPAGFFVRAGGSVNGIINSDDNTQTFNVPIKLLNNSGLAGPGAAMTWNAAAGHLIFNGANTAPGAPWTINLNGASALTIDGAFNISVGTSGPGQIVNTEGTTTGIIKNGTGTLFLGGTAANTFSGVNTLNAGKITAGKADALGARNALIMAGGTFETDGLNQALGTLDLDGSVTLDLGSGASAVSFADSSALDWSSYVLNISNWTLGIDTLRFGTDATGLTAGQLALVNFSDLGNLPGQIDANGYITPGVIPEPGTAALLAFGFAGLFIGRRVTR
jgi:autotransporter-associated beta strand protein